MKKLFLCLIAFLPIFAQAEFEADTDSYEVTCVRRCVHRSINGMCLNYGSDFCERGPGVACIPHCVQRSIQERCLNYGIDFCGIYPECVPHCQRASVTGQCLQYGPDACFTD